MKYSRVSLFVFCISLVCFFFSTQARRHYHTKHKHSHSHKSSKISQPPYASPEPAEPPYNDGISYNSTGLFNVRNFGAVGDGIADDTEAFKMAWDTACQSDSAVILVPHGFSFMIQSTIFTGPCQGGLVFQVIMYSLIL